MRPTLAVTLPRPGKNAPLDRLLIGLHDATSGLDVSTLSITSSAAIAGLAAGTNLADQFQPTEPGVWEWKLPAAISNLSPALVTVTVRDQQGNTATVVRRFSVE
ncbi:MAG: hypothetical protein AB7O62_06930 [Pirellulales bacterium]